MWTFFDAKSHSKQKAGAFVNWFKTGKLTDDGLHARFVESVLERRKTMKQADREERLALRLRQGAKKEPTKVPTVVNQAQQKALDLFTNTEGAQIVSPETANRDFAPMIESMNRLLKKQPSPTFDFEDFKKNYSEQYAAAMANAKNDYQKFYAEMGNQNLDLEKYKESIEHRFMNFWSNMKKLANGGSN